MLSDGQVEEMEQGAYIVDSTNTDMMDEENSDAIKG